MVDDGFACFQRNSIGKLDRSAEISQHNGLSSSLFRGVKICVISTRSFRVIGLGFSKLFFFLSSALKTTRGSVFLGRCPHFRPTALPLVRSLGSDVMVTSMGHLDDQFIPGADSQVCEITILAIQ